MQKKQKQLLNLKCPDGNQAILACASLQCTKPSLICQVKQCKCQDSHPICVTLTELSKLKNRLEYKGQSSSLILDEIYKWYQNQQKLISIEMQELKALIDKKKVILLDSQDKLYSMLTQEQSELIQPQLVNSVIKSMEKQPVKMQGTKEKIDEIKKKLDEFEKELKATLGKVNKMIDNKLKSPPSEVISVQDIKWSNSLHHPNIGIDNFRIIKLNVTGGYPSAFIEPPIIRNKYKNLKITFKINQKTSYISFGVCQIPTNFNMNDNILCSKIESGTITFSSNQIYVGKSVGHKKEASNVTFSTNDVIEVEYQIKTQKVTIKNISKNTQGITYIKTDLNQPVYVVVSLCGANDMVSIVDGRYYE